MAADQQWTEVDNLIAASSLGADGMAELCNRASEEQVAGILRAAAVREAVGDAPMAAALSEAHRSADEILSEAQSEASRVTSAAGAVRAQAERLLADARAEADVALSRAAQMITDARAQGRRIVAAAEEEAERASVRATVSAAVGRNGDDRASVETLLGPGETARPRPAGGERRNADEVGGHDFLGLARAVSAAKPDNKMLRDFFLGFVKVHLLHHASREPVYGVWFIEELARHDYHLSSGTLYPLLHNLEATGYLHREDRIVDGKIRKYYTITPLGKETLVEARAKIQGLVKEIMEADPPARRAPAASRRTPAT